MGFEKIIRINGINVKERLCVVDFYITCESLSEYKQTVLTHSQMYNLLDTATNVIETKDYKALNNHFAEFNQGVLKFQAFVKEKPTSID
jgi:hypothetical protein